MYCPLCGKEMEEGKDEYGDIMWHCVSCRIEGVENDRGDGWIFWEDGEDEE
jgi:hypothetical protein